MGVQLKIETGGSVAVAMVAVGVMISVRRFVCSAVILPVIPIVVRRQVDVIQDHTEDRSADDRDGPSERSDPRRPRPDAER